MHQQKSRHIKRSKIQITGIKEATEFLFYSKTLIDAIHFVNIYVVQTTVAIMTLKTNFTLEKTIPNKNSCQTTYHKTRT